MKLSDVMSHMGLSSYAEVALVIFFAVFVCVALYVLRSDKQAAFDRAARLPLDDSEPKETDRD
jgi:cbb3-type cytochrome oxidase subunit 3